MHGAVEVGVAALLDHHVGLGVGEEGAAVVELPELHGVASRNPSSVFRAALYSSGVGWVAACGKKC